MIPCLYLLELPQASSQQAAPIADTSLETVIAQLPLAQRQKAKVLSRQRQQRFAYSRMMLIDLLAKRISGAFEIVERDGLPPQIVSEINQPIPAFSISYSGGFIVLALASGASLGVDLQFIDNQRSIETARFFCTPAQFDALQQRSGPEQTRYLHQLWSLKEAWCKRQRLSILDPRTLSMHFVPTARHTANVFSCQLSTDYWLSLAVDQPPPANIFRIEPQWSKAQRRLTTSSNSLHQWQAFKALKT